MARLVRVSPVGVPQHIVQRGNNRQVSFGGEEDMKAYLNWLKEFSKKYNVDVHAWVLMTNHYCIGSYVNGKGMGKIQQTVFNPLPAMFEAFTGNGILAT